MATSLFRDTTYAVSGLVQDIQRGDLALPDIQRPFVWKAAKVRDLFDSMYRGFPVGFLLFWETGTGVGARRIGTGDAPPRLLIVDGQQRLTSLFAVMTGTPIIDENYDRAPIRIAFRPTDARFEVSDAAIEKDPEFIPDISVLWEPGSRFAVERAFLARLEGRRGELDLPERDRLAAAIDRLHDLHNYTFKAVVLLPEAKEEQVADIFVRINSEGVSLNQADFILTLMSVFWEKGRRELEEFARRSKLPTLSEASPFNWYLQPQPPQLLRVSVALAFRRARLQSVYPLLRGKDIDTEEFDPKRREAQFVLLEKAQANVLDLTNWHEFLRCLERAGFRGSKMISSDNAILFCYAMWLMGRVDYDVPLHRLREVIARWFFMAQMTGRYTGSFESRAEQDFARLREISARDADGYCKLLNGIVDSALTRDFWAITLPNDLSTGAAKSPTLLAYIAALNILDAQPFLSRGRMREQLDPAVTAKKGIERHHLFPRKYLKSEIGVTDTNRINQIANMALAEWSDNIAISDHAPAEYWPEQLRERNLSDEDLELQHYWHALPKGWERMSYDEFLAARRPLMAEVTRDAFIRLSDSTYQPTYPDVHHEAVPAPSPKRASRRVGLSDLLDAGLLAEGTTLLNPNDGADVTATVLENGRIDVSGEVCDTPSRAGWVAKDGATTNGWFYWSADTPDGLRTLASLRDEWQAIQDAADGV